jgi:hypothetical protein
MLTPYASIAANKVIDYGFEDFSGYDGNNAPGPGYIFSTSYQEYWQTHINSTHVISNCNGKTPYHGNYYFHAQFYTGAEDTCLGGVSSSVNTRGNIGVNLEYPLGLKDTTELRTDIKGNTLTIRLQFRVTGNWDSTNAAIDGGGGHKFIRVYGGDGSGDDSSAILKLLNDGDDSSPRMVFYLDSIGNAYREVGVNWQDGNWHPIVLRITRNNDTNESQNVTMTVWVDDWDMQGDGVSVTGTAGDFGSAFSHIALASNWSAQYPTSLLGYDIDDIEVWDGEPDDSGSSVVDSNPTITIASPTTGTTYDSNLDTVTLQGTASDDNGLAAVTWSSSNQQGTISSNLSNWSTGAITLQEGANQITVTATDTGGQTSSDTLTVNYNPNNTTSQTDQIWNANDQTGDPTWSDSTALWCVRALVQGSSIEQAGDIIKLGFMGRTSSTYQIRKVSIAEVDPSGGQGAVIDSTWTPVTFDKKSTSFWSSSVTTVPAGEEKFSDPIEFSVDPTKNYYITYTLVSPAVYLIAPSSYQQLYFDGSDHADDIDWTNNGYSTYSSRLHAISSIYVEPNALMPPKVHDPN